jgi:hypothetical protein
MSALSAASAATAVVKPAAIVAAYSAARAPFSVTLIPDQSILLQRAFELIDRNTALQRALVQQCMQRRDGSCSRGYGSPAGLLCCSRAHHCCCLLWAGSFQYVVGDWILSLLHVLIELEKLLAAQSGGDTLSVLLVSASILQCGALSYITPIASRGLPAVDDPQPILLSHGQTKLRVSFCPSWAHVIAAAASLDVRALYIPGRDTMLGCTGSAATLQSVVLPNMLRCLGRAELFPPDSWELMFDHKDATYARFGSEFMLPSLWVSLPSLEAVPGVAAQLLQGRADGAWMVKGSWSWGSLTAHKIVVSGGKCPLLVSILCELFKDYHQRRVCIQEYEPALQQREVRVFLVLDPGCASGWRQAVSVITSFKAKAGKGLSLSDCTCEMQQPTHGISLAVAGLIDSLLVRHQRHFKHAAALGIPVLRVDCGQTPATGRCFVNELGCMDQILFSNVHAQDLAYVQGKSYAEELMRLVRKPP